MIKRKTLLILGAGASVPYGFPSGERLILLMIETLEKLKEQWYATNSVVTSYSDQILIDSFKRICKRETIEIQVIKEFLKRLSFGNPKSIDRFLNANPSYAHLGKTLIELIILNKEAETKIPQNRHDWYFKLWCMIQTIESSAISKNELKIITFNYDRSLEFYLSNCISNYYPGVEFSDAFQLIKDFEFIHLHGSLGDIVSEDINEYLKYGSSIGNYEKRHNQFQTHIRIIREERNDPQISKARRLINQWASEIHFLGFGFDIENMRLLGLDKQGPSYLGPNMSGTVFGMPLRSANALRSMLPFLRTAPVNYTCNEYIDEFFNEAFES